MGTNFYIRKRATLEEKRTICDLIHNNQWQLAQDLFPKETHICKRSSGWQLLWNPLILDELRANGYKRPYTKVQIEELIAKCDIFDEYGEKFTPEQFWKEEVGSFLYKDEDHIDAEAYDRIGQYGNDWRDRFCERHRDLIRQFYSDDINDYGEFFIDGLRFTTSTQFS